MPKNYNPAVDAYIEQAAEFAQPILKKLRRLVHQACPEVTEVMKWSTPFFDYQGPLFGMPAFQHHVNLVFWKGKLLKDPAKLLTGAIMSGCGLKVSSLQDLPKDKVLLAYLAEAVALNEQGVKVPKNKGKPKPVPAMPPDLQTALRRNTTARVAFARLSPSHQREYLEWILEAKQAATRDRRIAKMLEQLAEGKSLNWKYERQAK